VGAAHGRQRRKRRCGCTNRCGDSARTFSGERRTLWCPPEAATATRDGGRRGGAATELRRGRLVDVVHGHPNKQHQEASYLTAMLRSGTKESGRRRRRGSTRRRSTGQRQRGDPRVWRWRQQGLEFRGRRRCGRPLNRPGGERIGVRARGQVRARGSGSGRVPAPVRLRLEVGDDGRGPPVGDCGRAAAGMGCAGPKQWRAARPAGKRRWAVRGLCWKGGAAAAH
jgi:hypothetical protein